jgi:SAM-dependent methyltransferase
LPFDDGAFDLVFSRATFEHFTEPEKVIEEIARTTAPGGWSLHLVDVKDHRWSPFDRTRPEKYLDFLSVPDALWEERRGDAAYCNRWRAGTFREHFHAVGFDEVYYSVEERTAILPSVRRRMLPRFRDRDDLDALCFWILSRKRT